MPKALFKFSSGSGAVDILDGGSIFITSPLDMNDPFEMRPAWTNAHQARFRQDEQRRSEMTRGMPVMVATEGGKLVPGGTMPYIPPSPQTDVESQRGIADMHNDLVFARLHGQFRVLSLVASLFPLDAKGGESDEQATLMWSHYADQFQGICVALDPSRFNNGIQSGGFAVDYSAERESLPEAYYDCFLALDAERSGVPGYRKDPGSPLLLPPSALAEQDRRHFISFLTHKSPAWSYETEVRMIYDMGELPKIKDYCRIPLPSETHREQGVQPDQSQNARYHDAIRLPPEAVMAVIFGTDTMMATVKKAFSILSRPQYSHVEVYWSDINPARYSVQYVKGDRSCIEFMQEERTRQIAQAKRHFWADAGGVCLKPARKGVNYDMSKFTSTGKPGC